MSNLLKHVFVSGRWMMTFRQAQLLIILIVTLPGYAAENSDRDNTIAEINQLITDGSQRKALKQLRSVREQSPRDVSLIEMEAQLLLDMGRWIDAKAIANRPRKPSVRLVTISDEVDNKLKKSISSFKRAIITVQKKIEVEDFTTAIALSDLGLVKYPARQVDFHLLKGEALYKNTSLDEAELELRKALKIDPMNDVARSYIEEIRDTQEAQTSTELAEWILIAKDKVGDFIVTFLALFAAFLVNSAIEPLLLRIKLNRARKSFEDGDYDAFTDLVEGLLDEENFTILRANFRIVLNLKGYDEARKILNAHVATMERLPTLLRILEREHEKMSQTT